MRYALLLATAAIQTIAQTAWTAAALEVETPWTEEAAATLSKADGLQADGHWNDALLLYEKALSLSPHPAGVLCELVH